ncbi:YpuI family protein [Metabacillus herbersteinensis]|uniref:YpuI family protein n=1 Tax=Metabacillus herbersteinensis TaxID=283816 RepID=A0ABV6GCY7_9BACI
MGNTIVKSQTEQAKIFLEKTVEQLSTYLNETTITSLLDEHTSEKDYFKEVLATLRKLTVYCEEGLDACQVILKNDPFRKSAAEQTLYRIYHQCIEEFFNPKSDIWYENSRSAYTGKNAIIFRQPTPHSLNELIVSLEASFQTIREELDYYETDYRTKIIQSK